MKKRIFSILLCLCMALTLFHATALAEGPSSIDITYEFDYGTLPEGRQNPETIVREPSGTIIELPDLEDCGERRLLGWQIKNSDDIDIYPAGTEYAPSKSMTFVAVYEEYVTLTVPFTTTVVLDDVGVPGATTFDLAIVDANAGEESYADVTVSGSVTTDGAGDYTGTLTLTGPDDQLWNMLCEGAFVQQVNAGEEGWTYDDTVWGLLLSQFVASSSADSAEYTMLILPATCKETDDGVYYDLDWEAESLDEMSFTNIYTKSTTKPAEPTESTRPTTNNTNTGVTTSVQTGDNSNLMLWLVLFAVSAIGAIGTGVYNKRRRNSRTK